jgi:1-deoxy-D-xylulose-5-phosphate synthase
MRQGTGLVPFYEQHPARFFDVGIAEEHAVTFAAGLAANGCLPVVAVYSTFLQRSYDQILHDVALQQLPVLFAIDRAGLNGADGATHHGIYDVSFLSHIPGIDIYEPPTTDALAHLLERLLYDGLTHPVAIRYPSGRDDARIVSFVEERVTDALCEGVYVDFDTRQPPETIVVTYGRLTANVLQAVERMETPIGIVLLGKLRPWGDTAKALADLCKRGAKKIVFCEEGIRSGGIAMNLVTELQALLPGAMPTVRMLAIDDREGYIPEPAKGYTPLEAVGLGLDDIVRAIKQ